MESFVLKQELGYGRLEHHFFSQLTVDRDPVCARFLHYFAFRIELLDFEAHLVLICEDELALEPLDDFFISFALEADRVLLIALGELDDEGARDT